MPHAEIDLVEEGRRARFVVPISAALWIGYALIGNPIASGFLMLGAAAASGVFLFHGLTVAISRLPPRWRDLCQVAVVGGFTVFLASYFLRTGPPTLGTVERFVTWTTLVVVAIIGYVTWKGAELLDRCFWFRGFVIVTALMFAFCWMGLNNIHLASDDDDEYAADAPIEIRGDRTPHFFVQFTTYVVVSFAGLGIGFWQQRRRAAITPPK